MFESAKSMNNLIDQLADLWQKQLIQKFDQMHTETTNMIQAVQDGVEYYQKATKKLSNLKNDLTNQKENIQSMTKL
ncbi:unnamed protein product (macronuclear) [Paramecium tetraurelia]|uniref:BLOC-1-related complex subunit 7 n=1 Tax=Paramecium tetraurelia TaxID=5888 RepID=A0EBZ8_PARTE|nr:uncharacterized protein GSPATT00025551001 [Paramecium tetraurelia]CAK92815.1 unnamed protein product [Paramecium tetraurelia]|eukprot:XP_001460212.1 hypothetical protein (macronuclear) [Paramecium tetraurelia strain d4-2]